MLAHSSKHLRTAMSIAILATMMLGAAFSTPVEARQSLVVTRVVAQASQMTASQAASKAKAIHGGKVLRVRKQGNVYKVRLLKKSGRVVTVTVRG